MAWKSTMILRYHLKIWLLRYVSQKISLIFLEKYCIVFVKAHKNSCLKHGLILYGMVQTNTHVVLEHNKNKRRFKNLFVSVDYESCLNILNKVFLTFTKKYMDQSRFLEVFSFN